MRIARFQAMALFLAFLMFLPISRTSAGEIYTYEFDRIEVEYAAEFTVYPSFAATDHWLTQIAGGTDKPLQILYGKVFLYNRDHQIEEEFIKLAGEGGSERFLRNSQSFEYYDGAPGLKRRISTQFWSGKKLDGANVVKDFNEPLKSVTLVQSFDSQGQVTGFRLDAQPLVMPGTDWSPFDNYVSAYESDPDSLHQSGQVDGQEVERKPEEPKAEEPKAVEQVTQP